MTKLENDLCKTEIAVNETDASDADFKSKYDLFNQRAQICGRNFCWRGRKVQEYFVYFKLF